MKLDAEVEKLYQLPLEEFTAARNALAKEAGPAGREIRSLPKPPVAAWAVNQVYWRRRPVYDALMEAASELRTAHKAVLSGQRADLRSVSADHEEALENALKAAIEVLKDAGHPASDATRQAIGTTLRGLPAENPPGRLARTLQPGGFEMLAGIPMRAAPAGTRGAAAHVRAPAPRASQGAGRDREAVKPAPDAKALVRARDEVAIATRALRAAEHAARREEFEAARGMRDAEKGARALESARRELESAQETFTEAERNAAAAERRRDEARRRADEADAAVRAAQERVREAERALAQLTPRT